MLSKGPANVKQEPAASESKVSVRSQNKRMYDSITVNDRLSTGLVITGKNAKLAPTGLSTGDATQDLTNDTPGLSIRKLDPSNGTFSHLKKALGVSKRKLEVNPAVLKTESVKPIMPYGVVIKTERGFDASDISANPCLPPRAIFLNGFMGPAANMFSGVPGHFHGPEKIQTSIQPSPSTRRTYRRRNTQEKKQVPEKKGHSTKEKANKDLIFNLLADINLIEEESKEAKTAQSFRPNEKFDIDEFFNSIPILQTLRLPSERKTIAKNSLHKLQQIPHPIMTVAPQKTPDYVLSHHPYANATAALYSVKYHSNVQHAEV